MGIPMLSRIVSLGRDDRWRRIGAELVADTFDISCASLGCTRDKVRKASMLLVNTSRGSVVVGIDLDGLEVSSCMAEWPARDDPLFSLDR